MKNKSGKYRHLGKTKTKSHITMGTLTKTDLDKILTYELFLGLPAKEVELYLSGGTVRQYRHREFIYRAGDPAESFCIILDGAVKILRHSPKGGDIIMHFAVGGEAIGALIMNQPGAGVYPISAKSMGASRVLMVPKSSFQQLWKSNSVLQARLNSLLYRRMSNIQDDKAMSTSPLRVRIASLLLRHLDQESQQSNQILSLVLTRQEIADALGVAVESVIRAFREWIEDGTISKASEKGPEIINLEKMLRNVED